MKKLLVFLWALLAASASVNAQGLTATLQQGDNMTPFYGPDAFVEAYNAAQKGAIITLSAGVFNTVDSITKQVTIIGNGCATTNRTRILSKNGTCLIINANNVTIEGVSFMYDVYIRKVSDTHLRKCYLYELNATHTHKNTVIDQCRVKYNRTLAKGENICFKNCILSYLYSGESTTYDFGKLNTISNPAYFSNCLIYHYFDKWCTESGSYWREYHVPYGVFKNCILGQRDYDYKKTSGSWVANSNYWQGFYLGILRKSSNEYYNNVFFLYPYQATAYVETGDEVYDELKTMEMNNTLVESQTVQGNTTSTWAALFKDGEDVNWWEVLKDDIPFTGDDGTVVGPYGGTGFSINPSIPRIVESKIDSNTDADGQLNVRIKVEVNP